jgi:Fe-S-cluster containining protein
MNDPSDFHCLKCSTCCRNLLENKDGVLRGLPLTDDEAKRFSAEVLAPKVAAGVDKPEIVILYQLKVNCCPNLNSRNECQIYEKRPLICQSFPIVAGAISNRCRVFNYRKPGVTYDEPYSMSAQLDASGRFEKYVQSTLRKNIRKSLRIWEYDLNSKKWVPNRLDEK